MKILFTRHMMLVWLLLASRMASAQNTLVKFEQLPPDLDLAQGAVNCMLQDHRGILWLGTWSGLVRYDGYKIHIFQQESGKTDGLQNDEMITYYPTGPKQQHALRYILEIETNPKAKA